MLSSRPGKWDTAYIIDVKNVRYLPRFEPYFNKSEGPTKWSIFQFPQSMQVCMKWIRILYAPVMISSQKNIMHTDLQSKAKKRHLTSRLTGIL